MRTIWAQQSIPEDVAQPSIFLAGPTLRSRKCTRCLGNGYLIHIPGSIEDPCSRCRAVPSYRERSWREIALDYLERMRFEGDVYVPEFQDWRDWTDEDMAAYAAQVHWEWDGLHAARAVAFWIPRSSILPGLTTNIEFGYMVRGDADKVILGYPADAQHMRYLHMLADRHYIPVVSTLAELLDAAIAKCVRTVH